MLMRCIEKGDHEATFLIGMGPRDGHYPALYCQLVVTYPERYRGSAQLREAVLYTGEAFEPVTDPETLGAIALAVVLSLAADRLRITMERQTLAAILGFEAVREAIQAETGSQELDA
jgi:hypothetical protein